MTVTEYLTAVLILGVIRSEEAPIDRPVTVFVPVNLRRFFPSRTMRNFVIQTEIKFYPEGENDYTPFVRYMLGVIVAAYREFESRAALIAGGASKTDRIREVIRETVGPITKAEIMTKCPDVSQVTVQRALSELLRSGQIVKLSGGRYTKYVWDRDENE